MGYRPNFCADCGERVVRAGGWRFWMSRRFCPVCEKKLRKANALLAPLVTCFGLLLITGTLIYNAGLRAGLRRATLLNITNITTATPVSSQAKDSSSQRDTGHSFAAATASSDAPVYLCGARTKKGTPCSRRVSSPIERCWQHRGKAAMLPPEKLLIIEAKR